MCQQKYAYESIRRPSLSSIASNSVYTIREARLPQCSTSAPLRKQADSRRSLATPLAVWQRARKLLTTSVHKRIQSSKERQQVAGTAPLDRPSTGYYLKWLDYS